jgi:glucokinase
MATQYDQDQRIVMSLDGGGTNFHFSATCGNKPVNGDFVLPSKASHLGDCLTNIMEGFNRVKDGCPSAPVAISFAFPGPADYPRGIIGDLPNLPAFRGGVALGPMLEDKFGIPVFINNDGDLFTYGEAIAGFLPHINGLLEKAGSPKRYKNLFGVTLGTGFGGGIVRDGELFLGDNSIAGEVWLLRNKYYPQMNAEEGASIRGVRRTFAKAAGIPPELAPEPKLIYDIATGKVQGKKDAAVEAFKQLGEIVGDAMAQALTLIDGLAVIGGGVSGAAPMFLPSLVNELNSTYYIGFMGNKTRRLASTAFNLEEPEQLETFLKGETREISVPGTTRRLQYDPLQRIGVGVSRLGTSQAVAIGAYAFALRELDRKAAGK